MRVRRLPVRKATTYAIVDDGHYPTDKEYIDLGKREGWLVLFRIVHNRNGTEYQYKYPDNYNCE